MLILSLISVIQRRWNVILWDLEGAEACKLRHESMGEVKQTCHNLKQREEIMS